MKSSLLKQLTLEEYRDWFEQNKIFLHHRTPYHHPAWLDSVAKGVNFETKFIGVLEGNELVAAIPGFLTRRGLFRLYGSPMRGTLTSSLGPISLRPLDQSGEIQELILLCNEFARKQWGIHYARFSLRNAPQDRQISPGHDWEQQQPGSYRLDLTRGVEVLWNALKSDCRRNIRRAQREEIDIVPFEDARTFYQIVDETYRRHKSSSWHKESFFRHILSGLVPLDLMWAWGAKYRDQIIAACLFLHDDQEVHFVSGASLPQFGSLPTSYLLHWSAIEKAAHSGLKVYNSDASQISSIDQFKESFRPVLEKRYTMIWAPKHVRTAQNLFLSGLSTYRKLQSRLKQRAVYRPAD